MQINAILIKPLDNMAPGTPQAFDKLDFERLEAMGAVRAASQDDPQPAAEDEAAEMLAVFRDPNKGPLALADMRESFERLRGSLEDSRRDHDRVCTERDEAREALSNAERHGTEITTTLNGQIESLTTERDDLLGKIDALTATPVEVASPPAAPGRAARQPRT